MSYDIFLQKVRSGEAAPLDGRRVRAVLRTAGADPVPSDFLVTLADGGGYLYVSAEAGQITINRPWGLQILDLVVALARADGLAIFDGQTGTGTYVTDEAVIAELPEGMYEPIEIVTTGADLVSRLRWGGPGPDET